MTPTIFRIAVVTLILLGCTSNVVQAQMQRLRANPGGPVDEVFWSPNIIIGSSVSNLPAGNLNVTIMHAFGLTRSGINGLYGLDGSANIRFGVDYGVNDRLSLGVGRSRFDKLYDFRLKANLLRQTLDDKIPLELAVKGDLGISTEKNGFDFSDRLNTFLSILVARKFSERLSLQVSPMFSHFNTVFRELDSEGNLLEDESDHFAIGLGGRYVLGDRIAILFEYLPVLGNRSDGTSDAFAIALNIETGGHVFQLFFKTSQWLTEQHVISRNNEQFFNGDLRFGFNVNRVF